MNYQIASHILPVVDGDSKVFWEGCQNEKLMIQRCEDCDTSIFYPRIICPHCMSDRVQWVESAGKGKIYSYTVARKHPDPRIREQGPFIIALVTLTEGVRMMTNIINVDINEVACEMPVEVVFEKVNEQLTIPKFQPIKNK